MPAKYPEIVVQLSGEDGNAFMILGRVKSAMRRGGVSNEDQNAFLKEAMSSDYDNLLQTCMKWVEIE